MARKAPHLKQFQWKKGESGNPNGRPRTKIVTSALIKVLEGNTLGGVAIPAGKTVADVFAEAMILNAIKGNGSAIKEACNRVEGLVLTELIGDAEQANALSTVFGGILEEVRKDINAGKRKRKS